jgi:hypothetical protein
MSKEKIMTPTKKKIVAMAVIMCITSATFFCSTLAYFTDALSSGGSMIYTGTTSAELIDNTVLEGNVPVAPGTPIRIMPGYKVSKTVTAKNTGTLPVYVRVKLTPEVVLAENARGRESEIDLSLISYDIDTANWVYENGYYYYKMPLTGGNQAPDLFTTVTFSEQMGNLYKDSRINFTVRIEIVQVSGNGTSALTAKGWAEPTSQGGGV